MNRHRVDAGSDPNFHVDANPDPDPDPDWHQNDADPHVENKGGKFTFIHNSASLHCLSSMAKVP